MLKLKFINKLKIKVIFRYNLNFFILIISDWNEEINIEKNRWEDLIDTIIWFKRSWGDYCK